MDNQPFIDNLPIKHLNLRGISHPATFDDTVSGIIWDSSLRIPATFQEEFRLIMSEAQNGLSFDPERDGVFALRATAVLSG
jgi:hypothetical protein